MSIQNQVDIDYVVETREQRELPNAETVLTCSRSDNSCGNNENNIIKEAINPIDTPPRMLMTPEVNRPCYMSHDDWFSLNGKKLPPGLYWHGLSTSENDVEVDEWISNQIKIEAITSNSESCDFGRLLLFRDSNGQWHKWSMPMKMLKSAGEEVLEQLLDQGFIFKRKKRNDLLDYLMSSKPIKRISAASKVGWHGKSFVLPNKIIGNDEIIFQSESPGDRDFQSAGTLESWKTDIGAYCAGNTPIMVSVATALAGTLLKILNRQQGGGIHWVGDSSSGKSTCIEVAASIWGSSNFVRSWSTTANGLEGIATTRNDTCLILDEIDEASPSEISKIIYMLANGQGKQRAGRSGQAKNIHRWRTIALSTGERTLASIMSEAQKQPNSGQLVRLININAVFEYGVFSTLHGFDSGRTLADHLKSARMNSYGVVGPAFIGFLLNDDEQRVSELHQQIADVFAPLVSNNLENRAVAICEIIALAGELGIEYGLLPWERGSVTIAMVECYKRWKDNTNGGRTEDERVLESVRNFIDKNGDSRFSLLGGSDSGRIIHDRAGWHKNDESDRIYLFIGCALAEAGGKYDLRRIVQALKTAGWIAAHDDGRLTKKTRVDGGNKNLYYICVREGDSERQIFT